jgi:predicted RNA-binding protein YlxR (DUF448 family)
VTGSEPQRSCLVCRRKRPQLELLRIARSPSGEVRVDPRGGADGRGAYVCRDDRGCREGLTGKGALARALRTTLQPDDLARLAREIEKESVEA